MIVYRVEDRKHGGPFNGRNAPPMIAYSIWAMAKEGPNSSSPDWPAAWTDIPGWPDPSHGHEEMAKGKIFGFANRHQLELWFGRFTKMLALGDYGVASYEVSDEDVMLGRTQLAFVKDRAKFLGFMTFEEFLSTAVDEKAAA